MASAEVVVRYLSPAVSESAPTFTQEERNRVTTAHRVPLRDGRGLSNDAAQLRRSGFALVPFRLKALPKLFSAAELAALDSDR